MKPCKHPDDKLTTIPGGLLVREIAEAWTCRRCGEAMIRLRGPDLSLSWGKMDSNKAGPA